MFQKSIELRCFASFSFFRPANSFFEFSFPSKKMCRFSSFFLGDDGTFFQRKFSTNRSAQIEKKISLASPPKSEENHLKNESFWFHRLKIPSNVKVSHSLSPPNSLQRNLLIQSPLLHFSGPLGSLEINFQKIDKYGLSFFKLHRSAHEGGDEVFLDFFVKKLSKKKTLRFLSQDQDSFFLDGKIHQVSGAEASKSKDTLCMLGSLVALCRNAVEGVSFGFVVYLELLGVGYKANILTKNEKKDQFLEVKVGQSHDIIYPLPRSIKAFSIKPTLLGLYSIDKTELKQIAAEIRRIKSPEPYKGKGIRFKDEVLTTKIGKKK